MERQVSSVLPGTQGLLSRTCLQLAKPITSGSYQNSEQSRLKLLDSEQTPLIRNNGAAALPVNEQTSTMSRFAVVFLERARGPSPLPWTSLLRRDERIRGG